MLWIWVCHPLLWHEWSSNIVWFWRVSDTLINLVFGEDRSLEIHFMVLLAHSFRWQAKESLLDLNSIQTVAGLAASFTDAIGQTMNSEDWEQCRSFLEYSLQSWGIQPRFSDWIFNLVIQWFLTSHSKVLALSGISADNLLSCHLLVPGRSKCGVLTKYFTYSRWISKFSLSIPIVILPAMMMFFPDYELQDKDKGL